jgi:CubicO group peptidase (beta-lactamase class C family)
MADLQAEVQAAADEMVAAGTETGLQIAVHRHGRVVADVVSGGAEAGTAAPVGHGTLFYAASTAKGVAASLAHALAERGDIAYDLRLAAAEPWWQPGTRFGYHALTFGFLLGETLRRVTGATMSGLLREVLTGPLGVADEVCFAVPSRRGSTFGMVGANGSAAYADIDSGLAVAVMRNGPPAGGLTAVTRIDRLIAGTEEHQ